MFPRRRSIQLLNNWHSQSRGACPNRLAPRVQKSDRITRITKSQTLTTQNRQQRVHIWSHLKFMLTIRSPSKYKTWEWKSIIKYPFTSSTRIHSSARRSRFSPERRSPFTWKISRWNYPSRFVNSTLHVRPNSWRISSDPSRLFSRYSSKDPNSNLFCKQVWARSENEADRAIGTVVVPIEKLLPANMKPKVSYFTRSCSY